MHPILITYFGTGTPVREPFRGLAAYRPGTLPRGFSTKRHQEMRLCDVVGRLRGGRMDWEQQTNNSPKPLFIFF